MRVNVHTSKLAARSEFLRRRRAPTEAGKYLRRYSKYQPLD